MSIARLFVPAAQVFCVMLIICVVVRSKALTCMCAFTFFIICMFVDYMYHILMRAYASLLFVNCLCWEARLHIHFAYIDISLKQICTCVIFFLFWSRAHAARRDVCWFCFGCWWTKVRYIMLAFSMLFLFCARAPRRRGASTCQLARCKRADDDVQCVGASAGKRRTHANV